MVAHGWAPDQEALAPEWHGPTGHAFGWWAVNRTPGHRAYFLVHIPKAAGESVGQDIGQVLPEQEGFYSSEACWGFPRPMLGGDVMVAFVREPVSHVYSLFLETKYDVGKDVRKDVSYSVPSNITVWLQNFDGGRAHPPIGYYDAYNEQTHFLSCGPDGPEDWMRADLAQASAHMDSLFFVGITEHYQASLCLFFAKTHIGQPLPPFCNCMDPSAWASFTSVHESHGLPPHSLADLSGEDVRLIEELTRLDAQLYDRALARFRHEAEEVERSTGTKILCED